MRHYLLPMVCAALVGCAEYGNEEGAGGISAESDVVEVTFSMNALTVRNSADVAVDNTAHNGLVGDAKKSTPLSRATLTDESITDLYVWEGKTLLCHQTSQDEDFGSPTVTLTKGEHSLTFVASKSEGQTWTVGSGSDGAEQGVWKCTKVGDTFAAVKAVSITASSKAESVELTRRNGRVTWTISDALPSATNMTLGVTKQCYGLDAALVGINEGIYSNTVNISSYAGVKGLSVGMMVLPKQTDGVAMSATFKVDAVCDYQTAITVMPNQVCAISGEFFTDPTPKATVTLSSDWGATTNYDIR